MVDNTMHMIQVFQINRTKNKGNKRRRKRGKKGGEEKKGGNTMNGNRTNIIIF